jgi:hypothetical protein
MQFEQLFGYENKGLHAILMFYGDPALQMAEFRSEAEMQSGIMRH